MEFLYTYRTEEKHLGVTVSTSEIENIFIRTKERKFADQLVARLLQKPLHWPSSGIRNRWERAVTYRVRMQKLRFEKVVVTWNFFLDFQICRISILLLHTKESSQSCKLAKMWILHLMHDVSGKKTRKLESHQ